jgi:hypothetical protein
LRGGENGAVRGEENTLNHEGHEGCPGATRRPSQHVPDRDEKADGFVTFVPFVVKRFFVTPGAALTPRPPA